MNTFLDRLRGLREDNDLTQSQVAAFLGTSQTMYARYERGRQRNAPASPGCPVQALQCFRGLLFGHRPGPQAAAKAGPQATGPALGPVHQDSPLPFRKQYAGCIAFYKFYVICSSLSNETML